MTKSTDGQKMQEALKKKVIPFLREIGFKGSYRHFRRINDERVDLFRHSAPP